MSWGYFADLRFTLRARAWIALKRRTLADFPLEADWSGFEASPLRSAFSPPRGKALATTVAKMLREAIFTTECLRVETKEDANVRVRIALDLDRSQLAYAGWLGALLEGVRAAGGEGRLALVNDGSYGGENGHELLVRSGERSRIALDDYASRRDALCRELYPESFAEADATHHPRRAARRPDPGTAMAQSVERYRRGDIAGARDRLDAHLRAGGEASGDLLVNYTGFLRLSPPEGDALARAYATVLASFRARPSLLESVPLVENVVAFLNENGRAPESLDVAFAATSRGTPWSPVLATNVSASADKAKDPARTERLLASLLPAIEADPAPFEQQPGLFSNLAALHLARGETGAAFRALERCVRLDPSRRETLASDADFAALHDDPRWEALVRR